MFQNVVLKDLERLPNKRTYKDPAIAAGLKSLCNEKNLIIRPAGKGSGIVVLDKDAIINKINRLLDDRTTYSILPRDPTLVYKKALVEMVNALCILDKKEKEFLIPLAPRIPIIYHLPKVHKDPTNLPGRLIVSGIDSVTLRIGRYIDHYLHLWLNFSHLI